MSTLYNGKGQKKGGAINAILKVRLSCTMSRPHVWAKTGVDPMTVPLTIDDELAAELRRNEEMTGGGPAGVLKALKVGRATIVR